MNNVEPVVRRAGAHALLVELADAAADPAAWHAELCRRREAGELTAVDIVPAARTVLLDGVPDPAAVAAQIPGWAPRSGSGAVAARLVEIPVQYGGPDLPTVAAHWGVTESDGVRRLRSTELRVACCGFAPGFAYLTG